MIYFLKGKLPWQGVEGNNKKKFEKVVEIKWNMPLSDLCAIYLRKFRNLFLMFEICYDAVPNYSKLKELIQQMVAKNNIQFDNEFDWIIKQNEEKINKEKEMLKAI